MSRNRIVLLPKNKRLLKAIGENIKLARLRRKLTMKQVAERAGISRPTLSTLEKGNPAVSLGIVLQVLFVLGLE
ncbi:MAG TPA: helix-turn-helix transcriptional regulator, partial [Salinimicrobium sp.]|nr:helix-turn-helix transcriptional regulator [Salinimicrobium sp.]